MFQHREKRMEQEKELFEKKIEWLTTELKTKTDELLNTNKDNGNEILELQGSLKNSQEQVMSKQHKSISFFFYKWIENYGMWCFKNMMGLPLHSRVCILYALIVFKF